MQHVKIVNETVAKLLLTSCVRIVYSVVGVYLSIAAVIRDHTGYRHSIVHMQYRDECNRVKQTNSSNSG